MGNVGRRQKNELSDNRRVARNATMLTIRTALSTLVGLYTSRVVLATLGVEDYGIYGVVGGIVSTMGFINASMAGATSRFLLFEMGKGNEGQLSKVFSTSLLIHALIALVVILIIETIGLWFLYNKLNIPPERMEAAFWVLQFSAFSTLIAFTQAPYGASIIAHEHMHIYAYLELLSSGLKLLVVYLLVLTGFDKLIFYACLTTIVGVLIALIYRLYCIKHFPECRFHFVWDKTILLPMLTFSGLDVYGNMCVSISRQGIMFLMNIFFGVVYNAAASIANTINGIILGFTTTISQAFRPQIVKQYAAGEIRRMEMTMNHSIRFTLLATSLLAVPCALEAPYVLQLWLGQVPEHAVVFFRLIVIYSAISIGINVCNAAIHSTGDIRRISFINGTFYLLMPIFTGLVYWGGASAEATYIISITTNLLIFASACVIIHIQIPQFRLTPLLTEFGKAWFIILVGTLLVGIIWSQMDSSFLRLFLICIAYISFLGAASWIFLFTIDEKAMIKGYATTWLQRIYNKQKD